MKFIYTSYIHFINVVYFLYILYTDYIHFICIPYTFYILSIQVSYIFIHVLVMFRTCSGQVFGVENKFFPKSFGGLWAILWHHRRCLRRGGKILKISFFFKKIKLVQKDAESSYEPLALIRIFISFFSSRFMHFFIFHIFQDFFLIIPFFEPLKGPLLVGAPGNLSKKSGAYSK